jgi:ParB family chromosome partitioning protein
MIQPYSNSIFWIEVEKISPNPYQPRREFDQDKLISLADSIKQYGILQPLVVTRKEVEKEDGGLAVEYELIAGERRLRASKIAGISQVPAIIRTGEDDDKVKLELAIIENLQREDLNPVDRAKAFQQLADEFNFKHIDIAKKVGKSREYVTNTLRILALPEEVIEALRDRKITEGHTRPILMLKDRPQEQLTLFKEILLNRLNVREAEGIARRIAFERVRKKDKMIDPEFVEIEEKLTENLGTRVQLDRKEVGGKITINFLSNEDLEKIINIIDKGKESLYEQVETDIQQTDAGEETYNNNTESASVEQIPIQESQESAQEEKISTPTEQNNQNQEKEDDLYFIKNFSV